MDEIKQERLSVLVRRAEHDLALAQLAANAARPLLDGAVYHCQQAAEKAMKAYLLYHDVRFAKTHDIRLLVEQATRIEPSFAAWDGAAEYLNHFAVAFRYDDMVGDPDSDEYEQAFAYAQGIYEAVLACLPASVHPT